MDIQDVNLWNRYEAIRKEREKVLERQKETVAEARTLMRAAWQLTEEMRKNYPTKQSNNSHKS